MASHLCLTEVTFPSISTVNTSAMAGGMCENPRKPEPSTTAAPQAGGPGSFGIAMIAMGGIPVPFVPWAPGSALRPIVAEPLLMSRSNRCQRDMGNV